jgi:hypothetical protein
VPAPPVGWDETIRLPARSTAAQNDADAQETLANVLVPSTFAVVQCADAPAGSVDETMLPRLSVATQKAVVGQETLVR